MKTVVCIKYVSTTTEFVEFLADDSDVDPAFLERDINEADYSALEEALRLRDDDGGEVVVVAAGGDNDEEGLRKALGMGADRAVRVAVSGSAIHDPISVARALAVAIRGENPDLVICGVQSADFGYQSTGPAIASATGMPFVAAVTSLERNAAGFRLHRDLEAGNSEVVDVDGSMVISVQAGINDPRFGSFKDMKRAKKVDIPVVDPGDLGTTRVTVRRMFLATSAHSVQMIEGGADQVAARIMQIVKEEN